MKWFRENPFLGRFLIALGVCLIGTGWLFLSKQSDLEEADARFANTASELNRLERLAPYPTEDNLRKMKTHAEDYAGALAKLRDELKMRVAPVAPMAPNEFQSHLRVAMNAVTDKARANKVKLPDKFYLGFDEFASTLPNEAAAPLLGQELVQLEWLVNSLLEARVESLNTFRRTPLKEERGPTALPTATPAAGAKPAATAAPATTNLLERNVVELTFVSTPAGARKIINQIAGANQHFCIIRELHVRNEKDKGPPREAGAETTAPSIPAASTATKPASAASLNFIVGNEKIETTAKIEIVRFTF
jgi:hypothetical protein